MAKKALNLNASEKSQLTASFDPIPVVWLGRHGGYDSFEPELEAEVDGDGKPTGKTVLCPLVAAASKTGKVPPGLAKKITDELGPEELLAASAEPLESEATRGNRK
jgi:hypothetical protein